MPYTCQTCTRRKVKCDKAAPVCSTCRKGGLECLYQAPLPRMRKRKLSGDMAERLVRYERILQEHGLLPGDADASPSAEEVLQEPISLRFLEPEATTGARAGKLLAGQGKSRYISSSLWRSLGEDEMQHISDDDSEDASSTSSISGALPSDPLTAAFVGSRQQNLVARHPTHANAMALWQTHVESVEPLCKILHIPSTRQMVEVSSQQPELASKADECLLFAIYHFAVFSMPAEDCMEKLGEPRAVLIQRYHLATRQALVNASFLRTTEMTVLQALILFLLACRYSYDAHTYWILTGVAVRIAQRMGLHRDGEKMGLPPFDVQMRRRLFYQLLPLEGIASQMSGTGLGITTPDAWDTQQPLNIDDSQMWPGMTEVPEVQKGATEMLFCLARSTIGNYFARAGRPRQGFKDHSEAEAVISEAEREVEEKFIRYCDIVNPLHFLTIGLARSGIAAMRLRVRMPKVRNKTASDDERRELFLLAQKILDTDNAAYTLASLRRFRWHVRPFFLFGTWDSLILTLTTLVRPDLLPPDETDAAWTRLGQVYSNHDEFLKSKRALPVAFGRLTLKAWEGNPPSQPGREPSFIGVLQALRAARLEGRAGSQDSGSTTLGAITDNVSPADLLAPVDEAAAALGSLPAAVDLSVESSFGLETADWKFWDQLIHDYQSQGAQEDLFSQ
ncbi:mitogen-activated protein kinase [Thozetella sp. PMI_491]|nr:mitogen-activated protein kinase [Thozetella sp. PMI_491]